MTQFSKPTENKKYLYFPLLKETISNPSNTSITCKGNNC